MLLVEHTAFLTESGTDTPGEFGKVISHGKKLICPLDIVPVKIILPFRLTVAERAAPVAKRYSAFHAARSLQPAIFGVEGLLDLSIVIYAVMNRTIAGFLTRYI
jgi:hypothetical protein